MITYETQTLEAAPEKSRGAMQRLKTSAGMVPNLAARMSNSPTLIEAFVTLREIVQAGTLDAKERETLGLTNAVENGCEWCVAFHSFVALKLGVDQDAVAQVRAGKEPADPRLRALVRLSRQLIARRGRLDPGRTGRVRGGRIQQGSGAGGRRGVGRVAARQLCRQLCRSGTGSALPRPALVARGN